MGVDANGTNGILSSLRFALLKTHHYNKRPSPFFFDLALFLPMDAPQATFAGVC